MGIRFIQLFRPRTPGAGEVVASPTFSDANCPTGRRHDKHTLLHQIFIDGFSDHGDKIMGAWEREKDIGSER